MALAAGCWASRAVPDGVLAGTAPEDDRPIQKTARVARSGTAERFHSRRGAGKPEA